MFACFVLLFAGCVTTPDGHFQNGIRAFSSGNYDLAVAEFTQAIRADPRGHLNPRELAEWNSAMLNNRGAAFLHLGEYERANSDFQEAIRLDGNNSQARNNISLVTRRQAAQAPGQQQPATPGQVLAQAAPGQQQQPAAPVLIPAVAITGEPVIWYVHDTATWVEAVGGIRDGGNNRAHIVRVSGNVSVPSVPANENLFGTVTNIMITLEGSGSFALIGNGAMLRIGNEQLVVVRDLTLRGHANNNRPLIEVEQGGTFHMKGNASVTGNRGGFIGRRYNDISAGGVAVSGGTFIMQDNASVSDNTFGGVAGIAMGHFELLVNATIVMQDNSSVSNNVGLGVHIRRDTIFTMKGSSSVTSNSAGGVELAFYHFAQSGAFIMQDNSSVSNNTDTAAREIGSAGGVTVRGGTFTMKGSASVSNNARCSWASAGGVFSHSSFTIKDNASVYNNIGGGVRVSGNFTMQDNATISGNTSNANNVGGGVTVGQGQFIMQGGTISNNIANNQNGGGVHVRGSFLMNNGVISGNIAQNGGGVVVSGIFTMEGGAISGNRSYYDGGGVAVTRGATFTKSGGTIYGSNETDSHLRNNAARGHAIFNANGHWRNATAGPTLNTDAFGFWLNEPN